MVDNPRTSPRLDMFVVGIRKVTDPEFIREAYTGVAWLSSARTVRRTLKWVNERNPYC